MCVDTFLCFVRVRIAYYYYNNVGDVTILEYIYVLLDYLSVFNGNGQYCSLAMAVLPQ